MAFQSPETDGSQDCLVQSFSTVVGQSYVVSFWVAITAAHGSNAFFLPQWDWGLGDQTNLTGPSDFYNNFTNTGPVGYQQFTFVETAQFGTSDVMFHGTDNNGAILLDNVSVDLGAPEPSSTLLASLGLLAGGLYLRKRRRSSAR